MEMGSPMASLYLLGNPDHYTGHQFVNVFWKNYVRVARSAWELPTENEGSTKVILSQNNGKLIALSNVQDYIYQPVIYNSLNLYDWVKNYCLFHSTLRVFE
ncbi:hypothetical protein M378DRAFT_89086 [Amanita muscaria Koide BX008]|uniref:Uncharacterized protein n=1 Tax=Amanita muscaria (strain Koide BX008) TaxID=946122 RepID=A0A0C2SRI6_AMAMK|nr:hypothetical protein M378DRAFT_89086 [Amanita muscaria Koide BX008]